MQKTTKIGLFLFVPTLLSLILANSFASEIYFSFLHLHLFQSFTLHHAVNDGLMVLFFFLMGLEIKGEFVSGSLSTPSQAALPLIAAVGGCFVPALIYSVFNYSTDARVGWAIPMATDIAFAVGVLSLFSRKVPKSLVAFLMALAVADDLFAVGVIALFYGGSISSEWLGLSVVVFSSIAASQFFKIKNKLFYIFLGVLAWFCVFNSGIHATVAGVILGFLTPMHFLGVAVSPHQFWVKKLQPIISFFIMPVFAFFNAGVDVRGLNFSEVVHSPVSIGIFLGLLVGKPVGVIAFSYIATQLKIAKRPSGVSWLQFSVIGFFAGIGFTMALFIQGLSFNDHAMQSLAKVSVLAASAISGIIGSFLIQSSFKLVK